MEYEIQMFGCNTVYLEKQFQSQYNINMYLAGLLSDAQELVSMGKTDEANQILNQVKYYFFDFTDTRNQVSAQKIGGGMYAAND
jgi:20S proteasome alpha/beta subunit